MSADWLSLALYDDEENIRTASTNRAMVAVKHRTENRFARYMKASQSASEAAARLSAIEDDIRLMANQIAVEYSAPEPDKLYEAAIKLAYGFGAPNQALPGDPGGATPCPSCGSPTQPGAPCPQCSQMPGQEAMPQAGGMRNSLMPTAAEVPADGQTRRHADPDEVIGDTPASSSGESFKGDKTLDAAKGDKSKQHPGETQEVADKGTWRDNGNVPSKGTPKVKHKVKTEDLGGDNPHSEQKGDHTKTFGDGHGVTDAVTPGTVTARLWHVFEG